MGYLATRESMSVGVALFAVPHALNRVAHCVRCVNGLSRVYQNKDAGC